MAIDLMEIIFKPSLLAVKKAARFYLLLIFAGISLHACTGLQTAHDYLLNEKEGLVFFSLTESGFLGSGSELTFINESTQKKTSVKLNKDQSLEIGSAGQNQNNYRRYDNPIGKLVVLRLPEGIYRFDQWSSANKLPGKHSISSSPGYKFKVMNDRALYLGNIHLLNSKTHSSLIIRDNRSKDKKLFFERYPRVDKSKLLISSKSFLDPAKDRNRVFSAYIGCQFDGYGLASQRRLPANIEKFRTLRIASKEEKISRIDGYRLKFKKDDEPLTLSMKIELSDASQYESDKDIVRRWMKDIKEGVKTFNIDYKQGNYFAEHRIITNVLDEKRMVYMLVMLDDFSKIITNVTFTNPPEYLRSYKTVDEFIPVAEQAIDNYQQCVIENLNQIL